MYWRWSKQILKKNSFKVLFSVKTICMNFDVVLKIWYDVLKVWSSLLIFKLENFFDLQFFEDFFFSIRLNISLAFIWYTIFIYCILTVFFGFNYLDMLIFILALDIIHLTWFQKKFLSTVIFVRYTLIRHFVPL